MQHRPASCRSLCPSLRFKYFPLDHVVQQTKLWFLKFFWLWLCDFQCFATQTSKFRISLMLSSWENSLYLWKNHPACNSHKYGAILYLVCQINSWNDLVNVSRSSGFWPALNKLKCVWHILVQIPNIKFHKNPSSGRRDVQSRQPERQKWQR
jgi:hypothetical protein